MIIPNTMIKGQLVLLDKYDYNQAIEYAREKTGIIWDSNRQRLSFYEYFGEYLVKQLEKASEPK